MSVYVALLEKIETPDAGCFEKFEKLEENGKDWIVLGHFDALHTYELKLNHRNLFQAIQDNNKKISELQQISRYFNPIYMISSESAEQFWSQPHPFLAIVKIHFADSVETEQAYQELLGKLPSHSKRFCCDYYPFRTIQLSDLILAVSAHELNSLLKFVLTLREYSCVGKVYSYVCLDYQFLRNREWKPNPKDKIDLFSMRFSVTEFAQAKSMVEHIEGELGQQQAFSVSGVDDIVVNWHGLDVVRLIKLYRELFLCSEDNPKGLPYGCFAEVTTRVGIPLDQVENIEKREEDINYRQKQLEKSCEKLHTLCESIRSRAYEQNFKNNWVEPLFALTSTLARISKTSVLDEFVYIMYAGVKAFLQNIEYRADKFLCLNTSQCQDFVENLARLMEHVLRIEEQLTHNPQMRPILYDIPMAMLEYILSFLELVSKVLQSADNPNKKEICFLLVPRLCNRIEAQELFPADPAGQIPGLVLVKIPLQMLYNPKAIQQQLSHEVSHFVGEVYRNRADRKNRYVQASSALMARAFFGDEYYVFSKAIQTNLKEYMGKSNEVNIAEMMNRVMEWVNLVHKDYTEFLKIIQSILQENSGKPPLRLNPSSTFITADRIRKFEELLSDLSILFREIYADICMLYLLPVNSEDYAISLIQDLHSERQTQARRYEQVAIRIYVGLKASECAVPWEFLQKHDEKLYKEMDKIDEHISKQKRMKNRLIPITSILYLLRYAEGCHKKLCEKQQVGLDEIRKMYNNMISSEMDYAQFIQDINRYRTAILEKKPLVAY